jgi:hemerythrin-like metal-binding protein
MPFVSLDSLPSTGNASIDADHQQIGEIINGIYDRWQHGETCTAIKPKLEELYQAIRRHFAKETIISRGAGYDNWEMHRTLHQDFLGRFENFVLACKTGENVNIDMFLDFERHLFEHEVTFDQEMWKLWGDTSGGDKSVLITWRPDYSVGVEQIDMQHRRLIDMVNDLYRDLDSMAGGSAIQERLKSIYMEAMFHFRSEEQYFSSLPAEEAETHKMSHEALLSELSAALKEHALAEVEKVRALLEGYVKYWLLDHIVHVDSQLKAHLR